jgi:glycosyltransferase involved in cell wall biosynthesis
VKDQQILLQAAANIRAKHPGLRDKLRLVIVGDGPLRSELEQLIQRLDLEDTVWLAGDRKDVPELLQMMDVFALPSLGEGISNTVLEAMASSLPVVATAVGGNMELVKEGFNGGLVPVGDCQALANAILSLLQNESERIRQGKNARQRVSQQFDWNRTVNAYLGVYDELLGRSNHTSQNSTG